MEIEIISNGKQIINFNFWRGKSAWSLGKKAENTIENKDF